MWGISRQLTLQGNRRWIIFQSVSEPTQWRSLVTSSACLCSYTKPTSSSLQPTQYLLRSSMGHFKSIFIADTLYERRTRQNWRSMDVWRRVTPPDPRCCLETCDRRNCKFRGKRDWESRVDDDVVRANENEEKGPKYRSSPCWVSWEFWTCCASSRLDEYRTE